MAFIPYGIYQALFEYALEKYPQECCGVLLGTARYPETRILHAIAGHNIAESSGLGDARTKYVLAPGAIVRAEALAEAKGWQVVGFFHSHTHDTRGRRMRPSPSDIAMAWDHYLYLIVGVPRRKKTWMGAWWLTGKRPWQEPIQLAPEAAGDPGEQVERARQALVEGM